MSTQQPIVLCVDDDSVFIDVIGNKLTQEGMSCVYASSGRVAFDVLAKGTRPNVILLDITMPDMDGFEVLEKLRQDNTLSTVPVIIFSNDATPENKAKAIQLGAQAFLEKVQVTPGAVVELIRGLPTIA